MLDVFQGEPSSDKSLNSKHFSHYVRWFRDCYNFFRQPQKLCSTSMSPAIIPWVSSVLWTWPESRPLKTTKAAHGNYLRDGFFTFLQPCKTGSFPPPAISSK